MPMPVCTTGVMPIESRTKGIMISKSLVIVVVLAVLSLFVSAASQQQMDQLMDGRQQFKRFRGEPIRFGKRVPREPIRFGKRNPLFETYYDY